MAAVVFNHPDIVLVAGIDQPLESGVDRCPVGVIAPAEVGTAESHYNVDSRSGKTGGLFFKILFRPAVDFFVVVPENGKFILFGIHFFSRKSMLKLCAAAVFLSVATRYDYDLLTELSVRTIHSR